VQRPEHRRPHETHDDERMANALDELQVNVWVLAAFGRLARQGLLDAAAPADDALAVAAQRLLIEAGWLEPDPVRPSELLRAAVPPGFPLTAASGYVTELLNLVRRFADGAGGGWWEDDPALIRWRGSGSGMIVGHIFQRAFADLPGVSERLDAPGARLLDVGVGAAGISIMMCRRHSTLRAVGIDVSRAAVAVAREETTAAGLADRVEIREQSVTAVNDVEAFDLTWVPQPFLPMPVLAEALPRLYAAARPEGGLIMALATNADGGLVGAAADVRHLMVGGGTMPTRVAADLLAAAGFTGVKAVDLDGSFVMVARRAGRSNG
jgi:SAM-dependent methyltransferase